MSAQNTAFPADPTELEAIILAEDAKFWVAYNDCNVDEMARYFTEDIEFYHDKGGLTDGKTSLVDGLRNGFCGSNEQRIRREAIGGTIEVYGIADYGAIIRGEHSFYVVPADREEYLDGQARFTHLWRFEEGQWRMARVYSFDHQAPE